jgi:hypothetical protein
MTERWTPVAQMGGLAAVGLAATSALGGSAVYPEAAWGLAGPLAGSVTSWLFMVRAAAKGQEKLLAFMTKAMAAKMLLFPAYVIGLVLFAGLRPIPFVVAFTGFFVGLYAVQAWHLKRLVAADLLKLGAPGREA